MTHDYAYAGRFQATVTVRDERGAAAQWTAAIAVPTASGSAPTARPVVERSSCSAPVTITCDGAPSTDDDGRIVSYAWSFGDGATATGATVSHTYHERGAFAATLTVTDDQGLTDSWTIVVPVEADPRDQVWVEDGLPPGAGGAGNEPWAWRSADPVPFSGLAATPATAMTGIHQHFFTGATTPLAVSPDDVLVAYVYLDPADPPSEVMLQWTDGNDDWAHRAYWGDDAIAWGSEGTASRRRMGPLPAPGAWVRLEIPADAVGLGNTQVTGMGFTLFGGSAVWDHVGKVAAPATAVAPQPPAGSG